MPREKYKRCHKRPLGWGSVRIVRTGAVRESFLEKVTSRWVLKNGRTPLFSGEGK